MKTIMLIATLATVLTVGSIQILKQAPPRQGKGALTTFRKDLKIHDYFEMDSSAQSYLNLIKAMGLIKKDGKSEIVLATDVFCIAKNDSGYFPAVLRKGELLKGLKIVYLMPREIAIETDNNPGSVQDHHPQRIRSIENVAVFEQEYPLQGFPRTLRLGAGKGQFAKDAYYVRSLQDALFERGYQVSGDGVFDRTVRDAVLDFQRKNRLKYQDGIVGDETMKALKIGKFREKTWYEDPIFDPIRDHLEELYSQISKD